MSECYVHLAISEFANPLRNGISNGAKSVSDVFEKSFLCVSLKKQIAKCERYELVPLFKHYLPDNQPILEAGCGSGRWVAWFLNQGWKATGLDWSEVLCARAREGIAGARFIVGDMRAMPFEDGEFGSIVALGSVEHIPEGPSPVLKEFYRVLRPGGIAIITVPFNGPVRKMSRLINTPLLWMKANRYLRRLLRKPSWTGKGIKEARKQTNQEWDSDFLCNDDGWGFYQYLFTKVQMREILTKNKFEIIEEFVGFGDEGILHSFGRIAGVFDYEKGNVRFSSIGKLLRRLLPVSLMGHMFCYIVRRV